MRAGLIWERHVRVQRQEPEVQDTSTDHDEVQVVPKPELEGVDGELAMAIRVSNKAVMRFTSTTTLEMAPNAGSASARAAPQSLPRHWRLLAMLVQHFRAFTQLSFRYLNQVLHP